ncbi:protein SCO2 homolog, mitochondrial [Mobula hypostoma]|uniref:protein SCO2 homolog, mitochondrial n=1 Tax=Mobula hypostoma TaxID=723540 RepID=UPI002FC2E16E
MYARLSTYILGNEFLGSGGQFLKQAAFCVDILNRGGRVLLRDADWLNNGHLRTRTQWITTGTEWQSQARSITNNCNPKALKHFGTKLVPFSSAGKGLPTKRSTILPARITGMLVNCSLKNLLLLTNHKGTSQYLREKMQFPAVGRMLRTCDLINTSHLARRVMPVTPGNLILLSHRPFSKSSANTGRSAENQQMTLRTKFLITCLFGTAVIGFWFYVHLEKKQQEKVRRQEQLKKLALGQGNFNLLDHTGRPKTKSDFIGRWVLLYFGFTHCPDICPDELEKMSNAVQILDMDKTLPPVQPIFITVDPDRDGVEEMAKYIRDFHPRMIGLTGTPEQIKELGKAYRVYYSAGPKDEDNDYIVDHTIIIYLLNPDGLFVDYYNRSKTDQEIAESIRGHMKTYVQLFS